MSVNTKSLLQKAVGRLVDRMDFWAFCEDATRWFGSAGSSGKGTDDPNNDVAEEQRVWDSLVSDVVGKYGRQEVTLNLLLQELDLNSKTPIPPAGAIPCFTIHASKGMEFGHVYLVGMVEDQLPAWAAIKKGDNSHEMQEERRNCFVAITRAQESLTMTYSKKVFGWPKEPSRFLHEMGLL